MHKECAICGNDWDGEDDQFKECADCRSTVCLDCWIPRKVYDDAGEVTKVEYICEECDEENE